MVNRKPQIHLARAYSIPADASGYRVLVDRVWPRGVTRETLALDEWLKELAPSTELRHWFGHRAERWDEFRRRYFAELREKPDEIGELLKTAADQPLLLIFGAKDTEHNNAVALREYLLDNLSGKS